MRSRGNVQFCVVVAFALAATVWGVYNALNAARAETRAACAEANRDVAVTVAQGQTRQWISEYRWLAKSRENDAETMRYMAYLLNLPANEFDRRDPGTGKTNTVIPSIDTGSIPEGEGMEVDEAIEPRREVR